MVVRIYTIGVSVNMRRIIIFVKQLVVIVFFKIFEIYFKDDVLKFFGKEVSEEFVESKNDRLYDKVRGRKFIYMMMFFEIFLN